LTSSKWLKHNTIRFCACAKKRGNKEGRKKSKIAFFQPSSPCDRGAKTGGGVPVLHFDRVGPFEDYPALKEYIQIDVADEVGFRISPGLSPSIHEFGNEMIHSGLSAVRQAHRPELIEGPGEPFLQFKV
jgi:hypothetical protein